VNNEDQQQTKTRQQFSSSTNSNLSLHQRKTKRLTHEKRLIRDLLNNYPTIYARPIRNVSQPLVINFGLTLTQLFDLGSTGQKMQTNTWKTFIWQDMNLVWDPGDYGGLATVCLPADSIWTPV
jgi:nicotinic acetylcholine receptor alpha-3